MPRGVYPRPSLAERFWSHVSIGDDCWIWTGARTGSGYGAIQVNGRLISAHRMSYALAHGSVPEGAVLRHSCDNPPCVNPEHLTAGTQSGNIRDAVAKGRWPIRKNENHPSSRLTWALVGEMRGRYAAGESGNAIARSLGISSATASRVLSGKSWVPA